MKETCYVWCYANKSSTINRPYLAGQTPAFMICIYVTVQRNLAINSIDINASYEVNVVKITK
jgi:hypothetical protein